MPSEPVMPNTILVAEIIVSRSKINMDSGLANTWHKPTVKGRGTLPNKYNLAILAVRPPIKLKRNNNEGDSDNAR